MASSRIGTFNGNNASTAQLGSVASGVQGAPFAGNCSVAGTWYTGTSFPPAYQNTYLFADYGVNWVQRATMKNSFQLQQIDPFISGLQGIVNVTQNPLDGSIVCVEIASANPVKKISYGGNQPPVIVMTSDKIFGPSALAVNFSGSGSHDPENAAISYAWDFGDGNTSTVANPTHNFITPAGAPTKFVVKLTVKDNLNLTSTDSIIISVNNTPPVVNITSPVKNAKYILGQDTLYSLQAMVHDAEHPDGQLTYEWQTILRHNNHQHPEPVDTNRSTSSQISRIGCNGDTYYWLINLTVTDAAGLSSMDSAKIFPLCPGDIILPVRLISFNVHKENGTNLVKWITDKEINCKEFIVERSNNGQSFEPINKQPARNQAGEQTYFYADDPYSGTISYYRLRMSDIDGTVSYSKTVTLVNGNETDYAIHILPNPVKKGLTLSTAFPASGIVQINISTADGKQVKIVKHVVNKGFSTIQLYQLEKLKTGTYFIELIQNDFHRATKFIKVD